MANRFVAGNAFEYEYRSAEYEYRDAEYEYRDAEYEYCDAEYEYCDAEYEEGRAEDSYFLLEIIQVANRLFAGDAFEYEHEHDRQSTSDRQCRCRTVHPKLGFSVSRERDCAGR